MKSLKVNKENTKNILNDLLKRSPNNYDAYAGKVQVILDDVKEKGMKPFLDIQRNLISAILLPIRFRSQKKKFRPLMKRWMILSWTLFVKLWSISGPIMRNKSSTVGLIPSQTERFSARR